MKALAFFSFFLITTCSLFGQKADLLSKKVDANFRNTSIEEILKSMETENLSFVYSPEIFDVKRRVSISRQNAALSSVLTELFNGQEMEMQEMNGQVLLRRKSKERITESIQVMDTSRVKSKKVKTLDIKNPETLRDVISHDNSELIDSTKTTIKDSLDSFGNRNTPSSSKVLAQTISFIPKSIARPYVGFNYYAIPFDMDFNYIKPKVSSIQPERQSVWDEVSRANKKKGSKEEKQAKAKAEKKFRAGLGTYTGYTQLNDTDALLLGGRLMYYPSAHLGIGLSGNAFMTKSLFSQDFNSQFRIEGGYGGLALEYVLFPESTVHLNFPLMIGAGGFSFYDTTSSLIRNPLQDSQAFFALEVGAELEINVAKFMKIGLSATYRDVAGINLLNPNNQQEIVGDSAFEGMNYGIVLKFGWF